MNAAVSLETSSTKTLEYVKSETVEGLRIGMLALGVLSIIGALFGCATSVTSLFPIDLEFSKVAAIGGIIWCALLVPTLLYFAVRKPLPMFIAVAATSMCVLGIIVGMVS